MKRIINKKYIKYPIIALFWFGIWYLLSTIIDNQLLFPNPLLVLKRVFVLFTLKDFWVTTIVSIIRVINGIIIGTIIALILAFLSYKVRIIHDIFYPLMTIMRSTPVASFIVLIVLFIGKSIIPTIITLIMVVPIIWANVYEGLKNINSELKEVCSAYKIPFKKRLKALYVPSVLPHFNSALISAIGLGWKAGIAAEILYPPIKSIGRAILNSRNFLETVDLYAWTAIVILISFLSEALVKLIIKITSQNKKLGGKNENNKSM